MGKNKQYAEQYAEIAMEQMRKYGIPASVTLAQGILESGNGLSGLALKENNHFGIKATPEWIGQGGRYGVYTDDRPDEKFCSYDSVADSYEHHSRFLVKNKRYAGCFELQADDYKGWTRALADAGYASTSGYAERLQRIIEDNGLQEYDRMVMAGRRAAGLEPDGERNGYSYPVRREEFMFVTSPFGMRTDPVDGSRETMHKGMDIRCDHDAVLATEDNGKVVAVNLNADAAGGKSVTVEYDREDGSKVQNVYMHLSDIHVKEGDSLRAGQELGVMGNTGRSTGEHLHFGVTQVSADGTRRDMDPAVYLAEIADKGHINVRALHDGEDLLARYRTDAVLTDRQAKPQSPGEWMKKLLSSEDSGIGLSGTADPILEMAATLFSSLMTLAVVIDNKEDNGRLAAVSDMASRRVVDLKTLLPHMKACELAIDGNGRAVLKADNGSVQFTRELKAEESARLAAALNDPDLTDESKRMRVAGMVNAIVLSYQTSQNFERGMREQEDLNEQIRR
ncbi:MAG: glucosaminidase domain-containing protein [Porphyromonadaceae bacterium]|nr:glucosaminidase domain-containing protein [Porphyromonadaceae bacterium]